MASTAKISNGVLVGVLIDSLFVTILNVARVSHGESTMDLQDMTSHDTAPSEYKEHILGLLDGDDITLEVFYRPSDVTHQFIKGLNNLGELGSFQIVYPDDSLNTFTFDAWVPSFSRRADIGKPMEATIRLKVEGPQDNT